jgi:hypothetical protein
VHLISLLKNKLLLQKNYGTQEDAMDNWPFWQFEENIKIINDLTEEEESQRKKQESAQQSNTPSFNPSSYMNKMGNVGNKFK